MATKLRGKNHLKTSQCGAAANFLRLSVIATSGLVALDVLELERVLIVLPGSHVLALHRRQYYKHLAHLKSMFFQNVVLVER